MYLYISPALSLSPHLDGPEFNREVPHTDVLPFFERKGARLVKLLRLLPQHTGAAAPTHASANSLNKRGASTRKIAHLRVKNNLQ